MGYSHILYLRDDAIGDLMHRDKSRDELALEVGKAILTLCSEPNMVPAPGGDRRATSEAVFNYGGAVVWVADRHSSQEDLFVWANNALQEVDRLPDAALQRIGERMAEKLAGRRP